MTKIRNSKLVLVIEYWDLRFVCYLVLGVWDFIDFITAEECHKRGRTTEAPSRGRLKPGP